MSSNLVACSSCRQRNRLPVVSSGSPQCGKCHDKLPWLVDATASEFDNVISTSSLPVLVDLWAPWCGPCKAIAPILTALSVERAGTLRVVKVNVDDAPGVSARLGVQGIPTMVLFDNGVEVGRQIGAQPADRLRSWIDSAISSAAK